LEAKTRVLSIKSHNQRKYLSDSNCDFTAAIRVLDRKVML
jgi:hypothetical protein